MNPTFQMRKQKPGGPQAVVECEASLLLSSNNSAPPRLCPSRCPVPKLELGSREMAQVALLQFREDFKIPDWH